MLCCTSCRLRQARLAATAQAARPLAVQPQGSGRAALQVACSMLCTHARNHACPCQDSQQLCVLPCACCCTTAASPHTLAPAPACPCPHPLPPWPPPDGDVVLERLGHLEAGDGELAHVQEVVDPLVAAAAGQSRAGRRVSRHDPGTVKGHTWHEVLEPLSLSPAAGEQACTVHPPRQQQGGAMLPASPSCIRTIAAGHAAHVLRVPAPEPLPAATHSQW